MTDAQIRRFYFPEWKRCAKALGWQMQDGRLTAVRLPSYGHPTANGLYQGVWDIAETFAIQQHRAVTSDDLRHAVNFAAASRVSAKDLNNAEANRAVALMRVLADPDDIEAMNHWLHPDMAAKRGLIVAIRGLAHANYTAAICRARFGKTDLEDLTVQQLNQVRFTLTNRMRSKQKAQ